MTLTKISEHGNLITYTAIDKQKGDIYIMKNTVKKAIVTTGLLGLMLFSGPIVQNNPLGEYLNSMTTMTTYAAEQQTLPYSTRWETQADGVTWKYRYDSGGYASDRWVRDEVDGNWYLMDENGIMRYGVFTSYGRYYLLSELHDGHFGHMVKNGEVYQGVTIVAEASGEYEGALSADTINALRSAGVNVDNVPDVTGTQHTTDGEDEPTTPQPSQETPSQQSTESSDTSWKDEEEDILNRYFGGKDGEISAGDDHPLSN